ncbi:MAG: globin domain-containing protein [Candidatus Limnocylindrales bacterium]
MPESPTLYDRVGGMPFFEALVDRFYASVRDDERIGPMYVHDPDDAEMTGPRRRLTLFLVQYWGGPTTYLAERGHPRLRARHFPFDIDSTARDRWLVHMRAAIDASDAGPAEREELHRYMTLAADAMRNVEEPPPGGEGSAPAP